MNNAFNYVKDHGIVHETDYPYKGVHGSCQKNGGTFKISGHTSANGCSNLVNALNGRPISIGVDAKNWSAYKSGVFSNCGSTLDHGVTLVGITCENWKVKNSWGTSWGEHGFIILAKGNTCGICNTASYPTK